MMLSSLNSPVQKYHPRKRGFVSGSTTRSSRKMLLSPGDSGCSNRLGHRMENEPHRQEHQTAAAGQPPVRMSNRVVRRVAPVVSPTSAGGTRPELAASAGCCVFWSAAIRPLETGACGTRRWDLARGHRRYPRALSDRYRMSAGHPSCRRPARATGPHGPPS